MVYDLTMLKTFYAAYSEKIERVRNVLRRPMTLAEKILYAQFDDGISEELQTGRRLCEFPSRPCGQCRMQRLKWPYCNL